VHTAKPQMSSRSGDINDMAPKAGRGFFARRPFVFSIPFIKSDVIVTYPDAGISYTDKDSEVRFGQNILLAYLISP